MDASTLPIARAPDQQRQNSIRRAERFPSEGTTLLSISHPSGMKAIQDAIVGPIR
jgi:hypothetical protein